MNLIKKILFESMLNEVGEATSSTYKYKVLSYNEDLAKYSFTTDSNLEYRVLFEEDALDMYYTVWEMAFGIINDSKLDTQIVTNKGEIYKVMGTITKILKTFVNDYEQVERIAFKGSDNRRDKLYQQYLSKHLPNNWIAKKDEFENFILIKK